jgi:hypothetical protein
MSGVLRMTKLPSPAFLRDFRALFSGGTLAGLGEGELLDRFVNRRDDASFFEESIARRGPCGWVHRSDGAVEVVEQDRHAGEE